MLHGQRLSLGRLIAAQPGRWRDFNLIGSQDLHHCFALAGLGDRRSGIARAVPTPTRVNATSIRFSTAAVAARSPSPGVAFRSSKRFIKPFAARLPGIIGMQPTTASTEPRGESGGSKIRFNSARTKAALNEAAGRPRPPISCPPVRTARARAPAPKPIHRRRGGQLKRTAKPAAATPPKKAPPMSMSASTTGSVEKSIDLGRFLGCQKSVDAVVEPAHLLLHLEGMDRKAVPSKTRPSLSSETATLRRF